MGNDQKQPRIKWTSLRKNGAELANLTTTEVDIVEGAILGSYWIRVDGNGRLEHRRVHEELPQATDETMTPFWSPYTGEIPEDRVKRVEWISDIPEGEAIYSPTVYVSHVGAGGGCYKQSARILESYGFQCLRSKRDVSGKFWERWMLPHRYAMRGRLKEHIESLHDLTEKELAEKICNHISFGSCEVSVQKACLVYD